MYVCMGFNPHCLPTNIWKWLIPNEVQKQLVRGRLYLTDTYYHVLLLTFSSNNWAAADH